MLLHADHGAQRSTLNELHLVSFIQIPMFFLEIGIDVPGVPLLGFVVESLQEVPASERPGAAGVGFGGSKRLRLISQIEKAGDATGLRIDFESDVRIT